MTIESLIKNCIGLNVRETLLAIQIAVNYNIKNKENVISNLIFNNINLDESSDQVQNYLLKIINSNIKKPNLKH
jgi:hypothetical protein